MQKFHFNLIFLCLLVLFFTACSGGGNGGGEKPPDEVNDKPKILASSVKKQIGDTDEYILGVLTEEGDSDSLSIVGTVNSSNEGNSIKKILYLSKTGEGLVIKINQETGLPSSMHFENGDYVEFSDFANNHVNITVYNAENSIVFGPKSCEFTDEKVEQKSLYPFNNTLTNKEFKVLASKSVANWLRFASVVANGAGCALSVAGAVGSGGGAIPLAVVSCSSFLLSAHAISTDNKIDDALAMTYDGSLCLIGDLFSCVAYLADHLSIIASEMENSGSQLIVDSDKDGVADSDDKCPNTPSGESVDADGCSDSQLEPGPYGDEYEISDLGMKFVYIKPGTFMMGSPSSESGRDGDEKQHKVTLTKGFYMQTTEVTIGQFRQYLKATGNESGVDWSDGDCPINRDSSYSLSGNEFGKSNTQPMIEIDWHTAKAFADWLSKRDGKKYRLPTEAQWEYAARAGTTGRFAGTGNIDEMGWYIGNSGGKNHEVGTKKPNQWGLYDLKKAPK